MKPKSENLSRYPETAKDALDVFEHGELIHVVELGGLGPGYELCIWAGIFRMIKKYHKEDVSSWVEGNAWKKSKTPYHDVVDDKLMAVSKDLELSGAQAGQIKNTTYQLLKYGWRKMMEGAPRERIIMLSKSDMRWPI